MEIPVFVAHMAECKMLKINNNPGTHDANVACSTENKESYSYSDLQKPLSFLGYEQ